MSLRPSQLLSGLAKLVFYLGSLPFICWSLKFQLAYIRAESDPTYYEHNTMPIEDIGRMATTCAIIGGIWLTLAIVYIVMKANASKPAQEA